MELRKFFLRKSNIIIASIIAALGVGCKSQKTAVTDNQQQSSKPHGKAEPILCKYGGPPSRYKEPLEPAKKYGGPYVIRREDEEEMERQRLEQERLRLLEEERERQRQDSIRQAQDQPQPCKYGGPPSAYDEELKPTENL